MKKNQFLLLKLAEECVEVAQRCSKQIQFGKDEIQRDQLKTNGDRLKSELLDLLVIVRMLQLEDEIPGWSHKEFVLAKNQKKEKMQKYLTLSAILGQLPEIKL
jgi:NTP pyrophosphatase (non-canonical NTP hydrolase)